MMKTPPYRMARQDAAQLPPSFNMGQTVGQSDVSFPRSWRAARKLEFYPAVQSIFCVVAAGADQRLTEALA